MKSKLSHVLWPAVGLAVAGFCVWALVRELSTLSPGDVAASLAHVKATHWAGAVGGAALAYAALAGYDRLALRHLGYTLSWPFIALASFVSYALSHNIGAAVFSGAVVRYRIYSTKGLTMPEVGVLVAFCAWTFVLGITLLGGILVIVHPVMVHRYVNLSEPLAQLCGVAMLAVVGLYVLASFLGLKPLVIRGFSIFYPRGEIALKQLIIGPMELIGAAAIIYFCLPEAGNPGFLTILGIFLASFSVAVFSHAPGGIGVLELMFVSGLKDMPAAEVLAALIVFRLFYLVLPLAISLIAVLAFERYQLVQRRRQEAGMASPSGATGEVPLPKPPSAV